MPTTANFEELKAVVLKSLETSGVLAQIRAQLRRSVYQAIDRQDGACQGTQKLCEAPGALLCTEVIGEFFEFHGLQHTLCVFQTEAQLTLLRRGRDAVAGDAGLRPPMEGSSLLQQLVTRSPRSSSSSAAGRKATKEPCQTTLQPESQTSNGGHGEKAYAEAPPALSSDKPRQRINSQGSGGAQHSEAIGECAPVATLAPAAHEPAGSALAEGCSSASATGDTGALTAGVGGSTSSLASPALGIAGPAVPAALSLAVGGPAVPPSSMTAVRGNWDSLHGAAHGPHMRLPPLSEPPANSLPLAAVSSQSPAPRTSLPLSTPPKPDFTNGFTASSTTGSSAAGAGDASSLRASSKEAASPEPRVLQAATAAQPAVNPLAEPLVPPSTESPAATTGELPPAVPAAPASPAGSSASLGASATSVGLLAESGGSLGSLPRPASPHGPLPPISFGNVSATPVAPEHAGGSGVKAARSTKREARRRTKDRKEKEKECESSSSLTSLASSPALAAEVPPVAEVPLQPSDAPMEAEAKRPELSEGGDPQEVEVSSLSHGESRETLGPDASGADSSTREPTPAGIVNPAYAASPAEAMGAVLSGSISISASDEEGFSEVVEEDILGSSQESLHVGFGDQLQAKKAGQSITEQSAASVFDSTGGPDASVDSVDLEKLDYLEAVDIVATDVSA